MNNTTGNLLDAVGVLELSNDLGLNSTEYLRSNATYIGDDDNSSYNSDVFFIVFGVIEFVIFALKVGQEKPE